MAAPTFIQEAETASWITATSPKATASFPVLTNDVLVAYGLTSDQSNTLTISGGGLTWTQQQVITTASNCWVSIWTAVASSSTSFAVTFTKAGAGTVPNFGGNVLTFRNSDGVGASSKTTGSGAPSLSLTTTQVNSAIVVANGDWAAVDGTVRTWRAGAGAFTEQSYARNAAQYTAYGGFHADATSIAAQTVGLTAPTGQTFAIAAVEVKGSAGGGVTTVKQLSALGVG